MTNLDSILKKQRHYFANKGPSGQGYGFSRGHVWMWELGCEESWVPKNWCFWAMVLDKTLESPLDCKEIQPVHPEGDKSRVFIGRTDTEAETPILWPPHGKSWLIGKYPDSGRDWGQEEKGTIEDEMAGWHHHSMGMILSKLRELVTDREPGVLQLWGRKESDTTEWLNWTWLPGFPPQALPTAVSSFTSPQHVSLHSQQQTSQWDYSTILKLWFPTIVPSSGPTSLSSVCVALARTVWFSFHLGCHRSAFSPSTLNVSPVTQTVALIWGLYPCFHSPIWQGQVQFY